MGMHTETSCFFCFLREPPAAASARACAAPSARSCLASKADSVDPPPRGNAASSSTTGTAASAADRFGAMFNSLKVLERPLLADCHGFRDLVLASRNALRLSDGTPLLWLPQGLRQA